MKLPKIRLGKLRRGNQVNPVVRQHGTDCGVLCGHHLPQASGAVPLLRREEHHQGNHGKKLILPIETGQELSPVPSSVILLLPMVSGCLLHLPCVLQRIVEQVSHRCRIVNLILAFDSQQEIGCSLVLHSRQCLKQIPVSLYRFPFPVCSIWHGKLRRVQLP